MFDFEIPMLETHGEDKVLAALKEKLGFVPNIYRVLDRVPTLLQALNSVNENFEHSAFTPAEREVIALTTSVFNECPYCVAGHSTFALQLGVDPASIEDIRAGGCAVSPRLQAIGQLTICILKQRGSLSASEMREFLNAGFQSSQILELLLGVAGKTITNFASKISRVPLDVEFADQAWSPSQS